MSPKLSAPILGEVRDQVRPARGQGDRSIQSCPVSSYNEWGTLEEVIVGRVENAVFAPDHISVKAVIPVEIKDKLPKIQGQRVPEELLQFAQEELDQFVNILEGEGVTVKRPDIYDPAKEFQTPYWSSKGLCTACPRDGILVIGDEIIETPMAWRSRFFEMYPYRRLFREYFDKGAKWTSAPKPQLLDTLYNEDFIGPDKDDGNGDAIDGFLSYVINESEIVFDAADFVRCGRDIFCQLSNVTNKAGIEWVRRHLGDAYRIHVIDTSLWRHPMHIDASMVLLAPGKILINSDDIAIKDLPSFLTEKWELIIAPRPDETGGTKYRKYNMCSSWLSANVLSLDEKRVIVENKQVSLIRILEENGFDVIPCPFEHYSPFGGGFHCATIDVRREGKLESYF